MALGVPKPEVFTGFAASVMYDWLRYAELPPPMTAINTCGCLGPPTSMPRLTSPPLVDGVGCDSGAFGAALLPLIGSSASVPPLAAGPVGAVSSMMFGEPAEPLAAIGLPLSLNAAT